MKIKTTPFSATILISTLSFILTACGGETTKESTSLKGTHWQLTSLNRSKPIGNRPITLSFNDGFRLSGNSGCNRYGGQLYNDGKYLNLDFSPKKDSENEAVLFSTKMYCPSPAGLMDQEIAYLAQLKSSSRYSVSGDVLTIKDGADTLIYKRIAL